MKANLFYLSDANGNDSALQAFTKRVPGLVAPKGGTTHRDATFGGQRYRLTHVRWNSNDKCLMGGMYKLRSSLLPSLITSTDTKSLPLGTNEQLGEPTCFCYFPHDLVVLVLQRFQAPFPTNLKRFLSSLGYPDPLLMEPVLTDEAQQILRDFTIIRGLDFKIENPEAVKLDKAKKSGAVNTALDILDSFGGYTVEVTVKQSRQRGYELKAGRVKNLCSRLIEQAWVGKLKVWGAENDTERMLELNLLQDRFQLEIDPVENGRHLDVAATCDTLRSRGVTEVLPVVQSWNT